MKRIFNRIREMHQKVLCLAQFAVSFASCFVYDIEPKYKIGKLYYYLNEKSKTATVTCEGCLGYEPGYSGLERFRNIAREEVSSMECSVNMITQTSLYVQAESVEAYKAAKQWKEIGTIFHCNK